MNDTALTAREMEFLSIFQKLNPEDEEACIASLHKLLEVEQGTCKAQKGGY